MLTFEGEKIMGATAISQVRFLSVYYFLCFN
jgi:hypothetical protein